MIVYQGHNSGGNHNYNAFFYQDCEWYLHFHKNYELAYVVEGQVELTRSGEKHLLTAGCFALLLPHEFHAYHTPESSRVWIAVFSADYVGSFAKAVENKQAESPCFICSEPVLRFLSHSLIIEKRQDVLMLKAALYAICSEFLASVRLLPVSQDKGFAQQTLQYLADHFQNEVTMADLAKSFGYEYHYVSRQFHRHFHMHFKQLLNIYRTEFARDQLLHTDRTVTDIAMRSGFQNSRTFNRVFLDQMGVTPTQFRSKRTLTEPVQYLSQPLP